MWSVVEGDGALIKSASTSDSCSLTILFFSGGQLCPVELKVTRPTNAHTVNVQYLPNGKAYELQTWYTDAARRPASATSAMTSKVKGQGRKVT